MNGKSSVAWHACALVLLVHGAGCGLADALTSDGKKKVSHGPGHDGGTRTPVALVADESRDPLLVDDYLRIGFLSDPNLVPTTIARPDALRAFFTVSTFFMPGLPLQDTASYVGLSVQETQNLVVYRCRPPDPELATLATWPNVMRLLQDDFHAEFSCPPTATSSPENVVYCIASRYFDAPEASVTRTLEHTYLFASLLFDPAHPELAEVLRRVYGIFPAFSGLGYAVRGSETGGPFTAETSLRDAIVPEDLLPNLNFAALGCVCLIVTPYEGRSQDPVDPDFVLEAGSQTCNKVDRLLPAHHVYLQ